MVDKLIADRKEFPTVELFCINIERGTAFNVMDLCQIVSSPVSVLEIYNSQHLLLSEWIFTFLKIIVVDRLIEDAKEFPRSKLVCINIESGTTLYVIDLWQIMIAPISVFEIYNIQELERKECTQLFEKYNGREIDCR